MSDGGGRVTISYVSQRQGSATVENRSLIDHLLSSTRMRNWMIWLPIIGLSANLCAAVHAAPPEDADPAVAPWFKSLRRPGTDQPCCGDADCRRVPYRIFGDHFQVFIGREFPRWTNPPQAWVDVPEASVVHRLDNPTGEGVACWFEGRVVCFVPASGS
jgi:hypothetical protein